MFWHFPYFNNVWLLPVLYSKFKIVLYFWSKHVWGQICQVGNTYFIFYIYIHFAHVSMFVWRMLTMVRESCHSCWYSENSSFLHSWAWRCDESCLYSGVAIWSFLCSFLYTLNTAMSNTLYDFFCCKISTKGFTSYSSLWLILPPSVLSNLIL